MATVTTLQVTSTTLRDGQTTPNSMLFKGMGLTGDNKSPQLSWSGAPAGTKSFAVTMYDPDAPTTVGFWHWILFDIPAATTSLEENAGDDHHAPKGATLGYTDFGSTGYGGPAPPPGDAPHHYHINVYALDVDKLGIDKSATGAMFMFMIREHTLAKGTLTGMFGR